MGNKLTKDTLINTLNSKNYKYICSNNIYVVKNNLLYLVFCTHRQSNKIVATIYFIEKYYSIKYLILNNLNDLNYILEFYDIIVNNIDTLNVICDNDYKIQSTTNNTIIEFRTYYTYIKFIIINDITIGLHKTTNKDLEEFLIKHIPKKFNHIKSAK